MIDKTVIYEVLGHLYRWHLDEVDVRTATKAGNEPVWVRQRHPDLDPGDRSCFGEMLLPVLGVRVLMKKADYTIEELNTRVVSDRYKIVHVSRAGVPRTLKRDFVPVRVSGPDLREYLFTRRGNVTFPDDALIARLREAVRAELVLHFQDVTEAVPRGEQVVHMAPLSPVANELWVFSETGRALIRFSSDLDLVNPDVWEHARVSVALWDIDEQVVVSLQEAAGSNAYLTRDQVGRALYNCVILGKRIVLEPLEQ
ncbi:MAG: hypothetical protein JXB13_08990 [Phycisphaerae bacterium]|nr:hypothetical protein [Phycisphaerae bacterium]